MEEKRRSNEANASQDNSHLIWKKLDSAASKELGRTPRDLKNLWEMHTRKKIEYVVEQDEEDAYDEEESDFVLEDDDEVEGKVQPKNIEDLKLRAIPLNEKVERKKEFEVIDNLEDELGLRIVDGVITNSPVKKNRPKLKRRYYITSVLGRIQASFGSTVVTFFKFLQWTTLINLTSAVLVVGLIIIPQLFENKDDSTQNDSTEAKCLGIIGANGSQYFPLKNASSCCSQVYQDKLQKLVFNVSDFFPSLKNILVSLLQGTNWMEGSAMFYGFYDGTFVFRIQDFKFDFPLAFLLVMVVAMIIHLILIVISSSKAFYKSSGDFSDLKIPLSLLVFTKWDFGMTSEKGITIQQADITTRLKLAMASQNQTQTTQKVYAIRVFINMLVVVLIGAILFFIYFVTTNVPKWQSSSNCTNLENEDIVCFIFQYLPSISVTAINIIFPFGFTMLIFYENYSNKNVELFLNLARCIALRLASLMVALLSMQATVNCDYSSGCLLDNGTFSLTSCNPSVGTNFTTCTNELTAVNSLCKKPICWETTVGQQFYMLTVVDFLAQVGLVFLFDFPRSILFGKMLENNENWKTVHNFVGRIEFNVTKHVLDIVYTQVICWLGIFFAPLISIVTVIKYFLMYGLRIFYILYVCVPSQIAFSASKASAFFKGVLLFSFSLSMVCVGLFIGLVAPSTGCGPFRDVICDSKDVDGRCFIYDYVIETINQGHETGQKILFFLGETSVLYSIAGVLVLFTYFLLAYSSADKALLNQMRKQLKDLKIQNRDKFTVLKNEIRVHFGSATF